MAYYNEDRGFDGGGPRKKSLLIGINYVSSAHELQGCHQDVHNVRQFLNAMGYSDDQRSQVIMRDDEFTDPNGAFWPSGHNMVAAMNWLISEPGTINFLHYSGHGGQVADEGGYRTSGFDDTIVPVDFERSGQIPSGVLHRQLVSRLPPSSTLFIIFDCCHSGSAVELPFVYRSDEDGNVNMMDNVKMGVQLFGEASHLIQGGFTMDKVGEAKELLAGATSFFRSLTHEQEQTDEYGLGEQDFAEEYRGEDEGGYRTSGFDDTIVPVDFERSGQIPSGVLHRQLVSRLPPSSTLFIIFDCCHSGSAVELPFVYRSDEDGNVNMMDNVKMGVQLFGEASHLIQGGFTMDKVGEAKELLAGATSFFRSLTHEQEQTDEYGLGEQDFAEEYRGEAAKQVWMYSGCRDDQTSADASIAGSHVGAMSWAFLECMKMGTNQSYIQVLQNTRQILRGRYQQVPQLSVGYEQDLNYPIRI
nr:metacaspase-1 [Quercus suber]